jgi:hypothetical protein
MRRTNNLRVHTRSPLSAPIVLFSLLAFLFVFINPILPATAQVCPKLNQVKVVSGVQYKCSKVGSKLQWVKQSAKSVATQNTARPTPTAKPTPKPKLPAEESRCNVPAARVGTGSSRMVCIKFNGALAWIKQTRLDRPAAFEPCLRLGGRAKVGGENLVCTETFLGKLWDFERDFEQAVLRNYQINSPGCHARISNAWLEQKNSVNSWSRLTPIQFIPATGCPAGAPLQGRDPGGPPMEGHGERPDPPEATDGGGAVARRPR